MNEESYERDQLTGLLNRSAFEARFSRLLKQAIEAGSGFSLAFVDIDDFKTANDRFGHLAGDAILQKVASLIEENCSGNTLAARYGGDEFLVVFEDAEREQAFLALERLRAAVAGQDRYQQGEQVYPAQVTISAGVASYPIDGQTEYELLRKAHQAIYRAKEGGRNTVRLAYEERLVPKTTHYTMTQLERLSKLAKEQGCSEADLLREALDDLLIKYKVTEIDT